MTTTELNRPPGGGGGTTYNGLYREAPPGMGTFERVGISLVEVSIYKREGKSVIGVCERTQKGLTDEFYGFLKSRKRSIFVIISYLNDSAFTAVKRDPKG